MEDEDTAVHSPLDVDVHIVDVVDGLVEGGVGIEVLAKTYTDALEILLEVVTREMLGAIEAHVFQEMGKAALVVLLLHGAHLLGNVEVGSALGPFVVADVIGESVGQCTHADLGVQRYGWQLLCACAG